MIIEKAALFLMTACNKIWCDVGVWVCHQRADSSLVARHIRTQIAFEKAHSRVTSVGSCCITLGRKFINLLRSDRWLTHRSIFRRRRFKECISIWRLSFGLGIAELELSNVARYRYLCTFEVDWRLLIATL